MTTSNETFPFRTVVTIHSLQSIQGKAINGSSAYILGKPNKGRYPCAIYASRRGVPLEKPEKKSIKRENIKIKKDQRCELLHRAGTYYVKNSEDPPIGMFWSEAIYERFPEDYEISIILATIFVGEYCEDYQRSYGILKDAIDFIPRSSKYYWSSSRYYLVRACIQANRDPGEALKWALQIDVETDSNKEKAKKALEMILSYSRHYNNAYDKLSGGPTLNVYRKTAKTLLSRYPDSVEYLESMGNAECLLGNFYKGAMHYRQVINSGQLKPDELQYLKQVLCLAQFQCPGAPMANYRVVYVSHGYKEVAGIPKSKEGSYEISFGQRVGNNIPSTVCPKEGTTMKDLNLRYFTLPTDPDDVNAFGGAKLPK